MTVEVNITVSPVEVSIASGVTQMNALTLTKYTGSQFSGTPGTGRYKVHTATISANAIVAVGYRFLDPTDFTLSTSVLTNDKITILGYLENDDVVLIWD